MEKYLSHNGNLIQRGTNKFIYRNYTPPAPNRDGIVLRIELTNNQNSIISFHAVSVDGAPIHGGEIYKGRLYRVGYDVWTDIPAGELENIVTGKSTVYFNTIELWIAEPYASRIAFSTLSWISTLYANVYVYEYVNPDTITGELVNRMNQVLNHDIEYTYNW